MLFPTLAFAAFFVVVLPLSWLLMPHRLAWGVFMVGASWFFYGSADWRFVPLLIVSTVVNHLFAWRIYRSSGQGRSTWTIIAVAANLAGLGWFKYIGFLGLSGQSILHFLGIGWRVPIPEIVLPVGISFFTFQALSYVIDTGRGKIKPVPLLDFAVYLSFFPHLIAGPIVRASEFLPQIKGRIRPRVDIGKAFLLISAGLFKKVVIASYLGTYAVDPLFGFPHQHAGPEALFGVYAYAIQIYADFSGYTDIAIGLALLLGIEFPQNFNAPYAATSLQDFWRRWHMTLSRWLRDYLYIPLGGNRRGRNRTYINVIITMLLGGLWHGAAWTFVAWGALHGIGLAVERWWGERKHPPVPAAVPATGSPALAGSAGAGRGSDGWIPTLVRVARRSGGWPPERDRAANGSAAAAQSAPSGSTMVVAPEVPLPVPAAPQRPESLPAADGSPVFTARPGANRPVEPAACTTLPTVGSSGTPVEQSAPPVNEGTAAAPGDTSPSTSPEPPPITATTGAYPSPATAGSAYPVAPSAADAATSGATAGPSSTVPIRTSPAGPQAPPDDSALAVPTPAEPPLPPPPPPLPPPPDAGTARDALTAIREARRASIEARIAAPAARTPDPPAAPTAPTSVHPAPAKTAPQIWLGRLVTFHFVCFAWIFFRATSFHNALEVIGRILTLGGQHRRFNWKVAAVVAAALAIQWAPRRLGPGIQQAYSRAPLWLQGLSFALVVSVIDMLGPAGVAPFIYFRF